VPATRLSSVLLLAIALGGVVWGFAAAAAARPLAPEDFCRFKDPDSLQIAPDGASVAYIVTSYDCASDESRGALWVASWDGTHSRQLTHGASVAKPRFAPDGRLSYLAASPAGGAAQLWSVDARGGAARQLSHVDGEIMDYVWSPDGHSIVLVMRARGDARDAGSDERPRPLVISAYDFKSEHRGYYAAGSQLRLYLLDLRRGGIERLTTPASAGAGEDESLPAFSPDGRQIAYVANDLDDPKAGGLDEIRLVAARPGSAPHRLASIWSPNHQGLEWSPDGRLLSFLVGNEPRYSSYIIDYLAVADVSSGVVRPLTQGLDRAVVTPHFASDGSAIVFAVEDDRLQYAAQVALGSGQIEHLTGPAVVNEIVTAKGHIAVLASDDRTPFEIYALENRRLRPLSDHNGALFAGLGLGTVEDIAWPSADGTDIHGMLVRPPGYVAGRRYPTIVWLHGGPNGQDDHSLLLEGYSPQLDWQLFASHGYVVVAVNYRGSTGRGAEFARSIAADWGDKEVADLLAAADYLVAQGIADPDRLGIGGWSYGGILTDYAIASDIRFRAAISGGGSGNQTAMWGADQYIVEDNGEIGPPWQEPEQWMQLSYPLFRANHIRTPTLFMGGDADFNVPIAGSEQMYQALRTQAVPTQLIVYPGEHHVFSRPSFLIDHYRRYLDWMARYLGPGADVPAAALTPGAGTPRARP
jgi:dipeptidyl aminopeptidase/acylaminoacyl peptidase